MTEIGDIHVGDLVEIRKGERVIRDRVVPSIPGNAVGLLGGTIQFYLNDGYTLHLIERAKPKIELPTEPGWYLDGEGDAWTLKLESGSYKRWFYEDIFRTETEARRYAPFTRLEPVPVTAKRVLDRLANFWEFGPPKAFQDEFNDIAAEFGVTY